MFVSVGGCQKKKIRENNSRKLMPNKNMNQKPKNKNKNKKMSTRFECRNEYKI